MSFDGKIRRATAADYQSLGAVLHDAVRKGPSPYSEAQRAAWVPSPPSGPAWASRLEGQDIVLAEQGDEIVGFMSLADGGYIDLAHIRSHARGRGVFRALFDVIDAISRSRHDRRLWVHASLMARPAFAALGFEMLQEERVDVGGESLVRFIMERGVGQSSEMRGGN